MSFFSLEAASNLVRTTKMAAATRLAKVKHQEHFSAIIPDTTEQELQLAALVSKAVVAELQATTTSLAKAAIVLVVEDLLDLHQLLLKDHPILVSASKNIACRRNLPPIQESRKLLHPTDDDNFNFELMNTHDRY